MISFFIPGEPPTATAQQKGYSRKTGKYYKPAELRDAEQKYLAYANEARPVYPMEGAVQLMVSFWFTAKNGHKPGEPKTSRPDTDNMVKLLKDVLTRCGFWRDDAQVAAEYVSKYWSDIPGIRVKVLSLEKR